MDKPCSLIHLFWATIYPYDLGAPEDQFIDNVLTDISISACDCYDFFILHCAAHTCHNLITKPKSRYFYSYRLNVMIEDRVKLKFVWKYMEPNHLSIYLNCFITILCLQVCLSGMGLFVNKFLDRICGELEHFLSQSRINPDPERIPHDDIRPF